MKTINSILIELSATSSKNEKISILIDNKDNDTLKLVLELCYNPFTNFFIKQIPIPNSYSNQLDLNQALIQLSKLSNREVTGNEAKAFLLDLLGKLSQENANILTRVVSKDIRCGFSANTINKVWGPNFIPEWPVMLCSPFEERLIEKITWPAILQLKMDGLRFNAIVKDNHVEYRTRNGKLMDLLGALDEPFIKMADGKHWVYDGELLVLDEAGNPLPRQTGNGILVKAQKGTLSRKESDYIAATLWDLIDGTAFTKSICEVEYIDRFSVLNQMINENRSFNIRLVESQEVENLKECLEIVEGYIAQGLEGAILKDSAGSWEDKRVRHQIKFKGELDCDLVCVGWELGTGKNSQRLGALVLESADGKVRTSVGSGFTDEDRDSIKKSVIGKIVTVKYNARISKKESETDSLFLPIYVAIRHDKDIADNSKNIK